MLLALQQSNHSLFSITENLFLLITCKWQCQVLIFILAEKNFFFCHAPPLLPVNVILHKLAVKSGPVLIFIWQGPVFLPLLLKCYN